MQLLADQSLPTGLWLLKWIDCFSFHHGSQSAHVELLFEKLDVADMATLQALTIEGVQDILKRPKAASRIVKSVRVQAAYLPKLFVGDVFAAASRVGQLRTDHHEVRVQNPSSHLVREIALAPPPAWPANNYRVINAFEFDLPRWENENESRCLVFDWKGTQYILPKVVVFRAFYGLHTRLIDAVLVGWPRSASGLISFVNMNSGLRTAIDLETGAWKILLETGTPGWMAAPLAFYLFDDYANEKLANVYTDHLKQNERVRGAASRRWFMNADIPYPLGDTGLGMKVRGFPLRRFAKDASRGRERFLITAITGHEQKIGDQKILAERFNSNAVSHNHTVSKDTAPPYGSFKTPVRGLPDTLAVSGIEADAREPENQLEATGIEIWPDYKVGEQVKSSSATGASKSPLPSGPAPIVSAGGKSYRATPAAPAVIIQPVRAVSQQFDFLVAALEVLQSTNRIVAFEVVAPPDGQEEIRSGRPCWSLADGSGKRKGWTFMRDLKLRSELLTGRARSVLVLKVELQQAVVVLLEIEASSSGNRMFAWPGVSPELEAEVSTVMQRMIPVRGVLADDDLKRAIAVPITGIRHHFQYEDVDPAVSGKVAGEQSEVRSGERITVGLREDLLLQGLVRAALLPSDAGAPPVTRQS